MNEKNPLAPTHNWPRLQKMLFAAILITTSLANAAPMPHRERAVQLSAREQGIADFLQNLFGLIGVPVSISPAVKGAVNGNFTGRADTVVENVSRAFGLVNYFDGAVMHVYAAHEMDVRTLPTLPVVSQQVVRTAREMYMVDARHTLQTTREGALVVSGTRRFIAQIEELARASQVGPAAQPPMAFKVFYLRYAWAQDVTVSFGARQMVVPGVASVVRSLVTASPRSPASLVGQDPQLRQQQQQQQRPTQPKLKGQGLGAQVAPLPVLAASDAEPSPGVAQGSPATVLGELQQVRIEADTRLNAVIVRDAPERLPFYEQLIASLDVEPQSLEIEATIIDVNTDRMRELGINWRGGIGKSSVLFGNGTSTGAGADTLLQTGGSVVGSAITPAAVGGVVSAVIGDASQFVARMGAMQSEGAARVVSSPQVVTLSNVEAIFDNSSTFYVRVAGRDEVDLFNVSSGTSLRVTPHVFKDASGVRIKLLVNLETGRVSDTQSVDAIPVVDRSAINTQALIDEGESLLIGGLTQDSSSQGETKVPLLGDIPLLGNLFKYKRDKGARIERMFLISPRLSSRRASSMGPKPEPKPEAQQVVPVVPVVPGIDVEKSSLPVSTPAVATQVGEGGPTASSPTAARRTEAAQIDKMVKYFERMSAPRVR
jgi:type III secretion protein C